MGAVFLDAGQEVGGGVEQAVVTCFPLTWGLPFQFSAPNAVRNLRAKIQTTSSTLSWEAPENLNPQNCTYWVQWTGQNNKNET